jgi:hypothetical protein
MALPVDRRAEKRTDMMHARRISLTMISLMVVLIALPAQASAADEVPFRAIVQETFTAALCSPVPSLCVSAVGTGQGTHLGQVRESASVVANLASQPNPGCTSETRETTLTGANGDRITLHATGQGCQTGPTTLAAVDFYVVTGGTGRFSGATGSGTINVTVDQATRTAVTRFSGVLSTPGSSD